MGAQHTPPTRSHSAWVEWSSEVRYVQYFSDTDCIGPKETIYGITHRRSEDSTGISCFESRMIREGLLRWGLSNTKPSTWVEWSSEVQ